MTLWYVVVFIAMSFGLVNTILMAVFERMREFGLLKAMGMKPLWIVREVVTEAFFLLIIGLAAGNALGLVTVWALSGGIDLSAFATGMETFSMTRMIYPAIWARDVITANGVVFGLGLLVSVYPAAKAARFTPVEALART
jgi:ABC-type antimicrobial peptide transport system permease subunit